MEALQAVMRSFSRALFLLASVIFWNGLSCSSYAQTAAHPPSNASEAGPIAMTECEGIDNCTTWTFLGVQGNGQWRSGEIGNLTVESVNGETIVIRRADSTGSKAGLTAVYTGTLHGDHVSGEFTSSWPGHWQSKSGGWYATLGMNSHEPPTVMHLCLQQSHGDCVTFRWENGQYTNYTNLPGQSGEKRILTLESFSRDSVKFRRVDYGSYPLTAVMTGQISSDGNSLVNGMIYFTSYGGKDTSGSPPYPIRMTWGPALSSIPGSEDLDRSQESQPQQTQSVTIDPEDVINALQWVKAFQMLGDILKH
jgi:hypothetical protein